MILSHCQRWISEVTGPVLTLVGATFVLIGCAGTPDKIEGETAPPVIDVTAVDYGFQAPDTIPSGWVTFRMRNKGEESHHFNLNRLPDGRTFADWQKAFQEPADSIMKLYEAGKIDSANLQAAVFEVTPDWAIPGNLEIEGGIGLVGPGKTGQVSQRLSPGHYVMLCAMNNASGRIHAALGMIHGLYVAESSSDSSPPTPDATIRNSGRELQTDGALTAGTQVIELQTEEPPKGESRKLSVWLARLTDTHQISAIKKWRYQNPAPADFITGFEYLSPSDSAYMTVDLRPGEYAWMSFFQGQQYQPLVESFTVE